MEVLDILERRLDSLTHMLGPLPEGVGTASVEQEKFVASTENVVDSLLSTHTLLSGAVGGRNQIEKAIKRAPELEKYLEPNFVEDNQQVLTKEVYINAVAPDLHAQFTQLDHIKKMETTLGAEYFRNIPNECTDKLKQVAQDNAEFTQQSELIEESLILAMKRYGEIQAGLLESLGAMNKRLEAIENKMQQKKREELDKDLPVQNEPN